MTEIINDDGLVAKTEKKYSYYVTQKKDPIDKDDLKTWLETQSEIHKKKNRHVCVKRVFDQNTGLGHTIYRTTGSFYVVREFKIYVVVFLHCVKFDILSAGPFHQ